MTITEGIHDMPLLEYVRDPAPSPSFNATMGHTLLTQSPRHAWLKHPKLNPHYTSDHSSRADLGTVAHAILLEGDESKVAVIDAEDWKTKAAREERDAARAQGLTPILPKDMATVRDMVNAALEVIYGSELCEDWMAAEVEQTLIWQESGTWCRSRPDKLTKDGRIYFDYKTVTTAHPLDFAKGPMIRNGYDIQVALGTRGIKKLKKAEQCTPIFVCQEIEAPYAVSFISPDPQYMAIAQDRLELALYQWRKCLAAKSWPAYPSKVCYVEPPGYYGMDTLPTED